MKIYSIFDDYTEEAKNILTGADVDLTIHPMGTARPNHDQMKVILENYDCVIIGTSQQITDDMFENINSHRIIATASVGLDHICIPLEKKDLVTVINTPKANAQSVAEYTFASALACCKRLIEARDLYAKGKDNKQLFQKPEDLSGKILGVVGAGNISKRIIEYGMFFGMKVLCWTAHPDNHPDILNIGAEFAEIEKVMELSDVVSVNLPDNTDTKNIISDQLITRMKNDCIFISVSRINTVDYTELFKKAIENSGFYVCLDLDVNVSVRKEMPDIPNVIVTPHIAGGTVETRKRMFREIAEQIAEREKYQF